MKVFATALVALAVLAGASLSAIAAEEYDYPDNIFKKIERSLP